MRDRILATRLIRLATTRPELASQVASLVGDKSARQVSPSDPRFEALKGYNELAKQIGRALPPYLTEDSIRISGVEAPGSYVITTGSIEVPDEDSWRENATKPVTVRFYASISEAPSVGVIVDADIQILVGGEDYPIERFRKVYEPSNIARAASEIAQWAKTVHLRKIKRTTPSKPGWFSGLQALFASRKKT